ncbi:LysE family translocator [Lichenicola sp.]|uniref:LysE family translocator n=1 Tax=Lichenicola sp. TaxID=2804529 RepID=UPI003B0079B0
MPGSSLSIFPLLPVLSFAFSASATPGPNNIMMLSAAAAHGLRRTLPQLAGVAIGFGLMVTLVACGLGVPLAQSRMLQRVLQVVGAVWMTWLAWKIAAAPVQGQLHARPPLSFLGACAFQWINPKGWIMAVAATATFLPPGSNALVFGPLLGLVFTLVSVPCVGGWALIGVSGARLLRHPGRLRAFNVTMALLLLGTVVAMLLE